MTGAGFGYASTLSFKKAKTPAIIKANKLRTTIGLRVKTKYKIGLNIAAFRGRN